MDTSVWVEHFRGRRSARGLAALLRREQVVIHPWVIGELALGGVTAQTRTLLGSLSTVGVTSDRELLALIDREALARTGIGWVDAELLAAAIRDDVGFWTVDRRLAAVAARLGLTVQP